MEARVVSSILLSLLPTVLSSPEVGVHFCCQAGQDLVTSSRESFLQIGRMRTAKCLPSRDRKHRESLEEQFLMTIEGEDEGLVRRKIRNIGDWNLDCTGGAVKTPLDLDIEGLEPAPTPSYNIRLEDHGSQSFNGMGNVILNGKPICDDGWGDVEARVACRMLGYLDGTHTSNSRFGEARSSDFIMDDMECYGEEDDLFECRYNSQDDCGRSEAAGVMCEGFLGSSNSSLTVGGELVTETGEKVESGTFCLAQDPRVEGKAFAVQCNTPKVSSVLSDQLWRVISATNWEFWRHSEDEPGGYTLRRYQGLPVWINVLRFIGYPDDGLKKLDKEVYENFINEMVKFLVELMDDTGDGMIEANHEGKPFENMGFRFLDGILKKAFIFFDVNEDDIVSLKEFSFKHGRNATEVSLQTLFGRPLDQWPSQIFKFYTALDADQNEELSMNELKNFIKRTFTVMDTNEDCKVSIEEVGTLVTSMGMGKAYGLAVETVLFPYFHLADFLLTEFFTQADRDEDEKTTIEEILNFDDWNWMEEMVVTAVHIGYPYDNYGPVMYIAGQDIMRGRLRDRSRQEETLEKLLEALGNMMDQPAYSSPPSDVCVTDK